MMLFYKYNIYDFILQINDAFYNCDDVLKGERTICLGEFLEDNGGISPRQDESPLEYKTCTSGFIKMANLQIAREWLPSHGTTLSVILDR
jgi:hypothetical protein